MTSEVTEVSKVKYLEATKELFIYVFRSNSSAICLKMILNDDMKEGSDDLYSERAIESLT